MQISSLETNLRMFHMSQRALFGLILSEIIRILIILMNFISKLMFWDRKYKFSQKCPKFENQKKCKNFRNLSMTATFDSRFSCRITFWIRKYHRLHLDQPKTGLLPLVSTVATFYYIQLMPAIFYSEHQIFLGTGLVTPPVLVTLDPCCKNVFGV